jgi:hypothetical protein
MSIKPIDLQTLFMKLNEVGKEQNLQKEAAALQQDQAAREQVQKELHRDHSVNEAPEQGESEKIRDREGSGENTGGGSGQKRKKDRDEKPEGRDRPVDPVDPDLGQHIDITS